MVKKKKASKVAAAPATPTSSGKVKKVKKVKAARRFEQSEIDEELPPELQDSEILGGSSDADLAVSDDSEEEAGPTSRAAQMIKQAENAMAQTKPEKGAMKGKPPKRLEKAPKEKAPKKKEPKVT